MSALATLQRDFLAALPEVHRRNVAANLRDALAAAHPVVRRLVGDAFFAEMAARYAAGHPCRGADLHDHGAELADFLQAYPHAAVLAYLPDVARLEWACHTASFAADAPAMDNAKLGLVPAEDRVRVGFTLQPAARLITSRFRIAAIWRANQPDADGSVEDINGSEWVLVHRHQNVVRVEGVPEAEFGFLAALHAGRTLEEASAQVPGDDVSRVLGTSLPRFVADEVICGFRAPGAAG